ncbi:MAG: TolC family protein [Acidobacteria bacterium]|nr:TolC family protein [Acidobacteriota bacterium]
MSGIISMVLIFSLIPSPVVFAQEAAKQATTDDLPPLPPSPIEKAQKDGTAMPLSLKDITKMALQNNLDIAIQDTNEQLSQQKILQAFGDYDPKLTGQLNLQKRKSASQSSYQYSTEKFNISDDASWNFTFQQTVKTGGTLQAQWNSNRSESNSTSTLFNPRYGATATVQFTQPLWRNFKIDSTRKNIKMVNLDLKTSDSQFKQKVVETIANIQSKYWDLVSAIEDYSIKRESVKLAQITLRDNKKKVQVGTLAPIEVTQAEFSLAQRELSLLTSEQQILSQENSLRQLVSNDRNAEIWSKVIVPTDSPDFSEYKIDLTTAIDTALKNRPELEQLDIRLQQSDLDLMMTRNNKKWQFNLTGQFGSTGTAGPPGYLKDNLGNPILDNNGNPIPASTPALWGGLGTAYKTVFTEGYTNWQIAFQLEIPLRTRSLDSQLAQQEITKRQQIMNRRNQEQQIQVEIRNAVQQLLTNRQQVATAEVQKRLAQEQLDGEVKRFEAGLSENFRVLEQQNNLATAENSYLSNLISYKKSIVTLQKAMYTLLEANEFEIAKGTSNNVPNLK